ncbi:MAG: carbohydrate ABC transporter substrate-binding protein [Verrucomicrobia bacterium]|nr:carbohydrate ABC transporter substrate-binding protein [Verrucomicrobiota bacterium]
MYLGITWDHPRGYQALSSAGSMWQDRGLAIDWERQSLEDFESRSVTELSKNYDLMVVDHPHLGQDWESVLPLEDYLTSLEMSRLTNCFVGQTLESYYFENRHFALPIDAATQVGAYRQDLIHPDNLPPSDWEGIIEWALHNPILMPLGGPHALMTYFSICLSLGAVPFSLKDNEIVAVDQAELAFDILARLYSRLDPAALSLNPIAVLEKMSRENTMQYCPLCYGYVNYAADNSTKKRPLTFIDAPVYFPNQIRGSVLGGTGLALSRRTNVEHRLREYLLWLVSEKAQVEFIPSHAGQPALRAAWLDDRTNTMARNFYRNTLSTVEQAWVRPQRPGYIKFQNQASGLVRAALQHNQSARTFNQELTRLAEIYLG